MLKPYRKIIGIYFIILLGIFVVFRALRARFTGETVNISVLATGALWVMVFTIVYWGYLIRRFRPRLEYIQTPGTELPDFTGVVIRQVEWEQEGFPPERLRDVLAQKLDITYFDEEAHAMKVRSRFTMRSWGACSLIRWEPELNVVTVASYPMANHTIRRGREGERQNAAITGLLHYMRSKREEPNGF